MASKNNHRDGKAQTRQPVSRRQPGQVPDAGERRYQSLFEHDLTGDFIAKPDGTIVLCNPSFAAIFGFASPAAACGTNLAALQPKPAAWRAFVRRLKQHKRLIRLEGAARRRDGAPLHILQTVVGMFNGRGALAEIQGYVLDDTERKRAEAELKDLNLALERHVADRTRELKEANQRYRTIIDSALVGIIILNRRGIIESVNPAAERIFGGAPEEIVGRNISRFMASPDQKQDEDFLSHYLKGWNAPSQGVSGEVLGRSQDGRAMMLQLSLGGFTHHGAQRFVAMVRNITKRKRLERELLETSERERQRIGHDLHDGLGQQLHGLSYLAALLERGLEEDGSPRAAEAGQLNKHLQEALDLTRSLAHGLQPVAALPRGLMMALSDLADRTGRLYRLDCRFVCRTPVLIQSHTAATHLFRIAQEAVNNAIKHGQPARIRIKLAATQQKIILSIRDNGAGIRSTVGRPGGMGLHIMQHRAAALPSSLVVQQRARGGTEVVCTVVRKVLLGEHDRAK